jgi:hypothetical protein
MQASPSAVALGKRLGCGLRAVTGWQPPTPRQGLIISSARLLLRALLHRWQDALGTLAAERDKCPLNGWGKPMSVFRIYTVDHGGTWMLRRELRGATNSEALEIILSMQRSYPEVQRWWMNCEPDEAAVEPQRLN